MVGKYLGNRSIKDKVFKFPWIVQTNDLVGLQFRVRSRSDAFNYVNHEWLIKDREYYGL